ENEQVELRAFGPERLELGRVEIKVVALRGDHHAGKAQLVLAAGELAKSLGAAERIGMGGADEAAGIIAFRFLGAGVAQARFVEIGAHAGGASEKGDVDAGFVHHADVLVEIEQHPVQNEARRAMLVVGYDLAAAEVLRHQLMRREVVLEIDDHRKRLPRSLSRYAHAPYVR